MSTKMTVVELPGKVSLDVVERLKELLERAESGQLQGLAYAIVTSQGCSNAWLGQANANLMSAAIGQLNFQYHLCLTQEMYEDGQE